MYNTTVAKINVFHNFNILTVNLKWRIFQTFRSMDIENNTNSKLTDLDECIAQ